MAYCYFDRGSIARRAPKTIKVKPHEMIEGKKK